MDSVRATIHSHMPCALPYTGKGVGIAVLDTGIFPHIDFMLPTNRIAAFKDFVSGNSKPYDDHGHGTHICGICAGNGAASMGYYQGVAPKSHLIVGKILDRNGNGNLPAILDGIRWVIATMPLYHTRILNISAGTNPPVNLRAKHDAYTYTGAGRKNHGAGVPDPTDAILVQAVNEAWNAGLIVVAAAGNNGPEPMSVTAPGISSEIITVGASDDYHPVYIHGQKVIGFSGRGPTWEQEKKPDVTAPGCHIMSCHNRFFRGRYTYTQRSGTSMSTAIVSGCIALLLEKYPSMTNADVKQRLQEGCQDLGLDKNHQGFGRIDLSLFL